MTLAILAGLFIGVTLLVLRQHGIEGVRRGLAVSYRMLRMFGHLMLLGMLLAAMMRVVMPADVISGWMGAESGMTGILIGMAVGMVVPGGPYMTLPLAASLMASGAGVGPIAAFVTAWSVIPINRSLVYELPLLGGRFTAARLIVSLPSPIIAGVLIPPLFELF
jgi:uncharacterized membrane protein YraQ (UPF0718 family)